jgi:hypothetical protein
LNHIASNATSKAEAWILLYFFFSLERDSRSGMEAEALPSGTISL